MQENHGGDIFIDSTHCPVQRPSEKTLRRMKYSGKKKRFTNNTNVYTNRDGVVIGISKSTVGSVGDITLLKECPMPFGKWEETMHDQDRQEGDKNSVYCDRGYQGIAVHLPGTVPMIPHKKTRTTPLTREQKRHNSRINSTRVLVEHSIGRLKRYARLTDPYDGTAAQFNREFAVIGGTMDNAVMYDPDTTDFTGHASLLAERVKHHLQAAHMEYVEPVGVPAVTHQEIRDIGRAAAEHGALEHVRWVGGDAELDGTGLLSEHCVWSYSVCWRYVSGSSLLPSDPVNSRFFDYPSMSAVHFNLPIGAAGERVIDAMSEKFGHRSNESVLAIYDAVWVAGLSILAADSTDAGSVLLEIRGVAEEYDAALGTIRLDEAGDLVADHYGVWSMPTRGSWYEASRYSDGRVGQPLVLE